MQVGTRVQPLLVCKPAACEPVQIPRNTQMATLFGRAPPGACLSWTDHWSWRPPTNVPAQRSHSSQSSSSSAVEQACRQRRPAAAQAPCCSSVYWRKGGGPRHHAHCLVCCSAAGAATPKETHIGFLGAGIMGVPMVIRPTLICLQHDQTTHDKRKVAATALSQVVTFCMPDALIVSSHAQRAGDELVEGWLRGHGVESDAREERGAREGWRSRECHTRSGCSLLTSAHLHDTTG